MDFTRELPNDEKKVLEGMAESCKANGMKAYLVGGAVRDLLLGREVNDLDICLEGDPRVIIEKLNDVESYEYYSEFLTSTVNFKNGLNVDLIRCRREHYACDGAMPEVEPSDVFHDLERRDFTINAMAFDLMNGEIIDPFGGLKDLRGKRLRKVHGHSFEEDPTRILRGIRYAARYGLELEDRNHIEMVLEKGVLNLVSNDRIMKEMFFMAGEDAWNDCFHLCHQLGAFNIDVDLLASENALEGTIDQVDARMLRLFHSISCNEQKMMWFENSFLGSNVKKACREWIHNGNKIKNDLLNCSSNHEVFALLNKLPDELLFVLSFDQRLKYKVINYSENLRNIQLSFNGENVKELGIAQGKNIGLIMKHVHMMKLDCFIRDDRKYLIENLGEIEDAVKHKN